MSDQPESDREQPDSPALFATIHFQSDDRPDGYTDEDICTLNAIANPTKLGPSK